jgi:hypothetical protein
MQESDAMPSCDRENEASPDRETETASQSVKCQTGESEDLPVWHGAHIQRGAKATYGYWT